MKVTTINGETLRKEFTALEAAAIKHAAAIYGNFARCTAEAVEGCNTILKGSFAAGYYA